MRIVARWFEPIKDQRGLDVIKLDDGRVGWIESKSNVVIENWLYTIEYLMSHFPNDSLTKTLLERKPDWELIYSPKNREVNKKIQDLKKFQNLLLGKTNTIGCTCGGWIHDGHIHSDWCDCKKLTK